MKQFLRVGILILLTQGFLTNVSFSMDTEDRKVISFSAHQKVFQRSLEELKKDIAGSIVELPRIFIAYGWGDKDNKEHQEHAKLVDALATDLKLFGFPIDYDLDVRCGGKDSKWSHADKILKAGKVVLIGSSHLEKKYSEEKGTISQEIDILRTRISDKGLVGVIPLWFSGDIKENFPGALLHLPARILEKGSLIDIGYFANFFELLIDIFHTEVDADAIGASVKTRKQEFIDTTEVITPEILQEYGLQIRINKEEQKKRHTEKARDILGLDSSSLKEKVKESPRKWGRGGYLPQTFNLPDHYHKSFIESTPQGQQESYLTLIWKKLDGNLNQDSTLKKCVIPGLGGMGKSRLARAYVREALIHGAYDAILWFKLSRDVDEAQNKSSLETHYRKWFSSIREEDSSKNDLFNFFNNKISLHYKRPLIIYDDFPSGDFLRDLLPQTHVHILITSRDAIGWEEDEMIPQLEGFQAEESVRFLQQKSGRKLEEEDALKVAKVLGGLPLALEQAASWVRVKTKPFSKYLDEFSKKAKELMKYKAKGSDYPHVVATTWAITMNSISELARKLMSYFAYLRSDDIPLSLFEDLDPEDAIDDLVQYSMIKRKDDTISLHQLVQLVNRRDDDQEVIEDLMRLFVDKADIILKDKSRIFNHFPHMISLYNYAKDLKECEQLLFRKFSWETWILYKIRVFVYSAAYYNLARTEEEKKEKTSLRKKIQLMLSYEKALFKDLKEEGDNALDWLRVMVKESSMLPQYAMGDSHYYGGTLLQNYREAIEWYKRAAEQGHGEAQCNLGVMYYEGEGVNQDYAEAIRWWKLAARQKNPHAQYNIGRMHFDGLHVSQDYVEAMKWYKLAADQGHIRAQQNLGLMYYNELGTAQNYMQAKKYFELAAKQGSDKAQYCLGLMYHELQDYTEAVNWYQFAAKQGHAYAQCNLGVMYRDGQGVDRNDAKAIRWFRHAAEQGVAEAQFNLGNMYSCGSEVLPQNDAEAMKWYRKAAVQGHTEAQYNLGVMYYEERNYTEAKKWWEHAAKQDYAKAQCNLGVMYANGQGVVQDYTEAANWHHQAAVRGDVTSQYILSDMYFFGMGVDEDHNKAFALLELAANHGHAEAQYQIGIRYMPQDYAQAKRYIERAANQGYDAAQCILGDMYSKGLGVDQDDAEAKKWWWCAAVQGNIDAQCNLGMINIEYIGIDIEDGDEFQQDDAEL